jgi:hypothetical protein
LVVVGDLHVHGHYYRDFLITIIRNEGFELVLQIFIWYDYSHELPFFGVFLSDHQRYPCLALACPQGEGNAVVARLASALVAGDVDEIDAMLIRLVSPFEGPRDGLEFVEGGLELCDIGPKFLLNVVRADRGVDSLAHARIFLLDCLLDSHGEALLDLLTLEAREHAKKQL